MLDGGDGSFIADRREGRKVLKALADTALDFGTSRMYPGIAEYFREDGRGNVSLLDRRGKLVYADDGHGGLRCFR